jgi:hypothetical protein
VRYFILGYVYNIIFLLEKRVTPLIISLSNVNSGRNWNIVITEHVSRTVFGASRH